MKLNEHLAPLELSMAIKLGWHKGDNILFDFLYHGDVYGKDWDVEWNNCEVEYWFVVNNCIHFEIKEDK